VTASARGAWLWAAPSILLLTGLGVWPVFRLLRLSFNEGGGRSGFGIGQSFYKPGTWSLENYLELAGDRFFWEVAGFTAWLGVVVAALCIAFGYPAAHFIWERRGPWKVAALAAVVVPKLSSLLVTVYGLKLILDDHGAVNSLLQGLGFRGEPIALQHNAAGVVIGKTVLVLPYTILLIWAGLERIDRRLLDAARGLGASPWKAVTQVTWPLSLPAVGTAALVSLIWGLGAFISPYLLGSPEEITLAVDVQRQMFENLNWPRAAAEGVALMLVLALLCGLYLLPQRWLERSAGLKGGVS